MQVCIYVCPPSAIKPMADVARVAFTMHELDHLPEGKLTWPTILNSLDLLITPTGWNRSIWRKLGVTVPIEVAPLGIDPSIYFPSTGGTCRFLSVHENLGSPSSRENWLDTLKAYFAAFSASDPVVLTIKTWKWKEASWAQAVEDVAREQGKAETDRPRLEVIGAHQTSSEMRALYQSAWLFLKNANREGWSLPSTEAIACGTRVAASRIQPLVSHLPAGTRWFTLGDHNELKYLFRRELQDFKDHLRRCQRHPILQTAKLVEQHLQRHIALD